MWASLMSKHPRYGPFDDVGQPTLLKSVCVNRAIDYLLLPGGVSARLSAKKNNNKYNFYSA